MGAETEPRRRDFKPHRERLNPVGAVSNRAVTDLPLSQGV